MRQLRPCQKRFPRHSAPPTNLAQEHEAEAFADAVMSRGGLSHIPLPDSIRLHYDNHAAQKSAALGADAFTHGSDIYFGQGQYEPHTAHGQRLIAHELAHAVQQGAAAPLGMPRIQRRGPVQVAPRLRVLHADRPVPGTPTTPAPIPTNGRAVQRVLQQLCPEGDFVVDPQSGQVRSAAHNFCPATDPGTHQTLPGADIMALHRHGCTRLCHMLASPHDWRISVSSRRPPSNLPDNSANTFRPGVGSGGVVYMPSPNSPEQFGSVTKDGSLVVDGNEILMSHELLSHAFLGDQGLAEADHYDLRGRGGHQQTINHQNQIHEEQSARPRGGHRDPFCGESFAINRGQNVSLATVRLNGQDACQAWRNEYNRLNGTNFTIQSTIPPRPGEVLPPDTVVNERLVR